MRDKLPLKIFLAVFAAIILATIVIFTAYSMHSRFAIWEQQKERATAAVQHLSVNYKEDYLTLADVLLAKPFFDLNTEERQLLKEAADILRPANELQSPPPEETTSLPQFITVTIDISVATPEGKEVLIPAGTRLTVVSKRGADFFVDYKGGKFRIPFGVTQVAP